jgi:hypothetical protein
MTDANVRSEANADVAANAVDGPCAAMHLEFAPAIERTVGLAEYRTHAAHTINARVQAAVSRTARIDPLRRSTPLRGQENKDRNDSAHARFYPCWARGAGEVGSAGE